MSRVFFDESCETFYDVEGVQGAKWVYETSLPLQTLETSYYEQRMLGITTDQAIRNLNLKKLF